MAELKTRKNDNNPHDFIQSVENEKRRKDALVLLDLIKDITGEEPKMWGGSIIGYGEYTYKYDSGRSGDWFLTGFSPRKQSLSVYIMPGFSRYQALLDKLGKYKTGKSCLYVNKLEDIDLDILKELISISVERMRKSH